MDQNIKDLLAENGEVLLDNLLENELLRSIPVLGTSIKLIGAVQSIRDKAYLNKIKRFIENLGEFSVEQRQKMLTEAKKDQNSRAKFGDALFTAIEQSDSLVKIDYLSIIFHAFSKEEITNENLRLMCHIINASFPDDLVEFLETERPDNLVHISSLGLAEAELINMHGRIQTQYHISEIGLIFRKIYVKYKDEIQST